MFDLGVTEQERGERDSELIEDDPEVPTAPVYNPKAKPATKSHPKHPYQLRSKGPAPIPALRVSRLRNQGLKSEQIVVASGPLECSGSNPILMSYH